MFFTFSRTIYKKLYVNVHFLKGETQKKSRKTCSSNSYILNYFSSAFLFVTNTIAPIVAKIADNTQYASRIKPVFIHSGCHSFSSSCRIFYRCKTIFVFNNFTKDNYKIDNIILVRKHVIF